MEKPTEIRLTLTTDDAQNVVVFGNRAQMSGREADLWVALKHKILSQVQDQVDNAKTQPSPDLVVVDKKES